MEICFNDTQAYIMHENVVSKLVITNMVQMWSFEITCDIFAVSRMCA
jgi:hypothetical protein